MPAEEVATRSVRKGEDGQHATKLRVVRQRLVRTHRAEAFLVTLETGRHADAGPAADTGEHCDILLALVRVGVDVADDPRRRLEAIQLLAVLRIDRLQIALQRAVEDDVAGGRKRARPHRERFRIGPEDLALAGVPGDEVPEVLLALRRE